MNLVVRAKQNSRSNHAWALWRLYEKIWDFSAVPVSMARQEQGHPGPVHIATYQCDWGQLSVSSSGLWWSRADIDPLSLNNRYYYDRQCNVQVRNFVDEMKQGRREREKSRCRRENVPMSSSANSCARPTLCGWCFTERPYTIACLNCSLIVRWMALH